MKKEERQHHAFLHWLGTLILQRERDGRADIDDDFDLLEEAFRAGWSWAAALEAEEITETPPDPVHMTSSLQHAIDQVREGKTLTHEEVFGGPPLDAEGLPPDATKGKTSYREGSDV